MIHLGSTPNEPVGHEPQGEDGIVDIDVSPYNCRAYRRWLTFSKSSSSVGGNDNDSTLGDGASSTTSASVTSSIFNYKYEHGRRYHAYREGNYLLPNDEAEQDRLDLHHHIFRLVLGGRFFRAPVKEFQRVLDYGTGTGTGTGRLG